MEFFPRVCIPACVPAGEERAISALSLQCFVLAKRKRMRWVNYEEFLINLFCVAYKRHTFLFL